MPALRAGDIVVMDNLPCHESTEVTRLIGTAGAVVPCLPAYGPDFNPIEQRFSKLKAWMRSAATRTVDRLIEAMGDGLRAVRPGDIRGWFGHGGDPVEPSSVTPEWETARKGRRSGGRDRRQGGHPKKVARQRPAGFIKG